jgi:hypothetical protein
MAQIGEADDAGADPRLPVPAARAHRGDAVGELGLAYRLHRLRPLGAVHRARLHIDRGADVVPAFEIGEELVQQIPPARPVPEMMMRVDDLLPGIERRLQRRGQPVRPNRQVVMLHRVAHAPYSGSSSSGAMLPGMPSSKAFSVSETMQ